MTDIVPELDDHWASDLNMQQELFVLEYIANNGKAGKAARAAGYAEPYTQGPRLVKNVRVAAAIRVKRDELARTKHLSPDRILEELAIMAGFDIGKILTNGVLDPSKVKGEATRAIASVEVGKAGYKVKTHDKQAALKTLMDHLGMLSKSQTNVQVVVDFGDVMAQRIAARSKG
jgi:phage terminase small subunit